MTRTQSREAVAEAIDILDGMKPPSKRWSAELIRVRHLLTLALLAGEEEEERGAGDSDPAVLSGFSVPRPQNNYMLPDAAIDGEVHHFTL
jgi:hypothetical protein